MLSYLRMWFNISPKMYRMKRRATLNPFGSFSSTGVRRGSRVEWTTAFLSLLLSFSLFVLFLHLSLWVVSIITFVAAMAFAGWFSAAYYVWSCPHCEECDCRTTHLADCAYDARFRRYETMGMWLL